MSGKLLGVQRFFQMQGVLKKAAKGSQDVFFRLRSVEVLAAAKAYALTQFSGADIIEGRAL